MNFLTINGKSTADFATWISGDGTFGSPERDVEEITVPGRNGSLLIDNGRYNNIEVSYDAFILKDFDVNMAGLRNYIGSLTGYQRLEDTYHPDVYRMASFTAGFEPKMAFYNRAGEFTIKFNCKPQRWLKEGEKATTITTSGAMLNPTLFNAKPLIRAYGTGTITIGDYSLVISDDYTAGSYLDIDCEIMNAYYDSTNYNNYISGDFPELEPGENTITFTGTSLEITPRWWML